MSRWKKVDGLSRKGAKSSFSFLVVNAALVAFSMH